MGAVLTGSFLRAAQVRRSGRIQNPPRAAARPGSPHFGVGFGPGGSLPRAAGQVSDTMRRILR